MSRVVARHEPVDDDDRRRLLRRTRFATFGGGQFSAGLRHIERRLTLQRREERRSDDPGVRVVTRVARWDCRGDYGSDLRAISGTLAHSTRTRHLRMVSPGNGRGLDRSAEAFLPLKPGVDYD